MRTKDLVTAALVACLVACSVTIVLTEVDAAPTSATVTGLDYDDGSITLYVDKPGIYKARINDSSATAVSLIDKVTIKTAASPTKLTPTPTYSKPMVSGSTYSFILKDTSGNDLSTHSFTLWTVSFNGDGGTGTMASKVIAGSYSLPDCGFTAPTGKVFKAWLVGTDEKAPGESITVGADTEVKALWKDATTTVTVTVGVNDAELGTVSETSVTVSAGTAITADKNVLTIGTKTVTATPNDVAGHTVEFDGWDGVPPTGKVDSNISIDAKFKKAVNKYTVTVKSNNDSFGTVDPKTIADVPYGSKFSVVGNKLTVNGTEVTATPAANSAQYSYQFKSWSVENNAEVQGNVEVTATFEQTLNKYTVTVKSNNDSFGTVDPKTIADVPYGTQVKAAFNVLKVGEELVEAKAASNTAEFTFSFDKWEFGDGLDGDGKVAGDATVTAVFTKTVNKYTVTVEVEDPETGYVKPTVVTDVPYGTTVDLNTNPLMINGTSVKATPALKTAEFTFSFEKWESGDGIDDGKVVGNATIKAFFVKTTNMYTVTVVSDDTVMGTVSPEKVEVLYGRDIRTDGSILYVGGNPVTATPADKTDEFTYSFVGWSENATGKVFGDMTIVANFKAETNKYPVTVTVNDSTMGSADFYLDGTKIDSGTEVEYGKTVTLAISQVKGYTLTSVKFNGEVLFKEGDELKLVYSIVVGVENKFEVGFTKTTELQYDVKLTCETGNGRFIPGPNADGVYILNGESSMDFQILADFGYRIKSVTLDGIKQDFGKVSAVVPIKNIVADHKIVAEFEKADTYPIQLIGASNGKVEITGLDADGRAVEGRSITITATPDFGFYASKFLVNGVDIDTTTGAVSESRTISVDKSLDGGKIVVEVKFALAASGDEEDDPTPSPPTPAPQTGGDGGKDEAVKVAAVAAACVAVVVIALYMVVWRKD